MISVFGDEPARRFVSGDGVQWVVCSRPQLGLSASTRRCRLATCRWKGSRRISCRISQMRPSTNPTTSATNSSKTISIIRSLFFELAVSLPRKRLSIGCLDRHVRQKSLCVPKVLRNRWYFTMPPDWQRITMPSRLDVAFYNSRNRT
jgi:hypothetical protein